MRVLSAERVERPPHGVPEVAFAGRSNVGKSSMINALLGQRIAPSSSTPGRTRRIYFYSVRIGAEGREPERSIVFADLPGYGFARVSKALRSEWRRTIEAYLRDRPWLRAAVAIVDPRAGATDLDRGLLSFLAEVERPVVLAVTKMDKIPRSRAAGILRSVERQAEAPTGAAVGFSAVSGLGKAELWDAILDACFDRPGRTGAPRQGTPPPGPEVTS